LLRWLTTAMAHSARRQSASSTGNRCAGLATASGSTRRSDETALINCRMRVGSASGATRSLKAHPVGAQSALLEKCQLEENAPGRLHRFADVEPGARTSSLARDEVLADHLGDVPIKRDGELVLLDAFDLTIAEHRMMHGVAN